MCYLRPMANWKRTGTIYGTTFLLALTCTPRMSKAPAVRAVAPKEEDALIGIGEDAGVRGMPLPSKPAEWQQPGPPCRRGEHAIMGACYMRYSPSDMSPPCDGGTFEYKGECWRAVAKVKRMPVSGEE